VSYFFDPVNYMAGWNLVIRMSSGASILGQNGFENFVRITKERGIYLYAPALLLIYSSLELIKCKRIHVEILMLYFICLAFFFSFFFSTWGPYPRYFAPAYIAIIILSGIIYANNFQRFKINVKSVVFLILMLLICVSGLKYSRSYQIRDQHSSGLNQLPAIPTCLYHSPIELTYEGGNKINFIVSGLERTFAEAVASKHNLKICE
jgi:hypothetical protein